LFESPADVRKSAEELTRAQPFAALAGDPSLRGVMTALSFATGAVQAGRIKLMALALLCTMAAACCSSRF
jgi:hypothetical protein